MKLNPQQLPKACHNTSINCFILHGNEPFLIEQYAQHILAFCHDKEIEIHRLSIDTPKDWTQIMDLASNLSLFSDKQLLDVRFNKESIDAQGKKTLIDFLDTAAEDCQLLLRAPQVKQFTFLKKHDPSIAYVRAWPLKAHALMGWIKQQFADKELSSTQAGYQLIAEFTEGNLQALAQAIEKLALQYAPASVSVAQLQDSLSLEAHYDIFHLADTCLLGKVKIAQILKQLQAEGVEPTLVLWALTKEIRLLIQLHWGQKQGQSFAASYQATHLWESKKSLYQTACKRLSLQDCQQLLLLALKVEESIKGVSSLNTWQQISILCHALAQSPQTFSSCLA